MKKVLQINSVVNSGSTGRIVEEIGLSLMKEGWQSYIAYGRYGNPSKSITIRIGNKIDNYFHVVSTRLFDKHGFASTRATKKFIKKLEELDPDIIHIHNIHGYYINLILLFEFLSKANKPIVWTLHDCWAFTGHCSYFSYIDCDKWKIQCYKCPQLSAYPSSLLIDSSKSNYARKRKLFNSIQNLNLIPVSNWLNGLVGESFLAWHPSKVIHNGVDLHKFNDRDTSELRRKLDLKKAFYILGVANQWNDRKGFKDFISLGKYLNSNEKVILVGLTKKQLREIPEHIIGIEKTQSVEELATLYSLADVFVNTTYDDNFPTTNIESLACGTPIITYNTGGSIEAVSENTGFVVEQGNLDMLIDSIRIIKAKGKSFYSRVCRERAINNFNKEERYNEYLKLYKSLIK